MMTLNMILNYMYNYSFILYDDMDWGYVEISKEKLMAHLSTLGAIDVKAGFYGVILVDIDGHDSYNEFRDSKLLVYDQVFLKHQSNPYFYDVTEKFTYERRTNNENSRKQNNTQGIQIQN